MIGTLLLLFGLWVFSRWLQGPPEPIDCEYVSASWLRWCRGWLPADPEVRGALHRLRVGAPSKRSVSSLSTRPAAPVVPHLLRSRA
jgi:hypothetical protein